MRGGLHAEGLPDHQHHGRHRPPRRRCQRLSALDFTLERLSVEVWPSRQRETSGGWALALDAGVTGRLNAATPISAEASCSAHEIDAIEAWYRAQDSRAVFKWDGVEAPPALAARGYAPDPATLVMTADVGAALARLAARLGERPPVALLETPDAAIAEVIRASGPDDADFEERWQAALRTPAPRRFALSVDEDGPAGVGLTVLREGWACIMLMRTRALRRRGGHGAAVLSGLLQFAAAENAGQAFLQVDADNAAAIALYERAGFSARYSYRLWRCNSAAETS